MIQQRLSLDLEQILFYIFQVLYLKGILSELQTSTIAIQNLKQKLDHDILLLELKVKCPRLNLVLLTVKEPGVEIKYS